jgi:Ser/Thr protein kinase RdoA (MazF antagonist)
VPYRPDVVLQDRGLAATAWELVPRVRAVEWHAVGVMLARLHRLDPDAVAGDYPVPAAASFPWWRFDELLQEARPLLDGPAHDALAASVERYSPWMYAAAHTAGAVLCHGDVHPGNVIGGPHGPVLLDWDLLCTAPPEWDHAPLLAMIARWGADARSYGELAAGYGADLSRRPLTMALRELRLVAATLMRVLAEGAPPRPDSEAALRLQYWRGDRGAPPWHLV